MENPWSRAQNRLHSALTDIYHDLALELGREHPNHDAFLGMVQGFMLVTEFTGLDGSRKIDLISSEDARLWEIDGWISFVQKDLQAQSIANVIMEHIQLREDEDD